MITCDLTGNIGNHQFQYSITRTVAEHNNYEWGFNPITSNDYYGGQPQMNFFDINYGKQHTAKWKEMPEGVTNIWQEKHDHFDTHDFYYYQPDIFDVKDNTKLIVPCVQNAKYYNKEKLRKWFQIKEKNIEYYESLLDIYNIVLDENLCIINIRGGEYKYVSSLLLRNEHWRDAIVHMTTRNPKMQYYIITDDTEYAKNIFPYPVAHFGIGMDYYIINHSKNLIISNSSFAILPTWLNYNDPFVIAPRWWARHNVAEKYWASSNIYSFNTEGNWNFLDRDGKLYAR